MSLPQSHNQTRFLAKFSLFIPLLLISVLYTLLTPYTKVEESFPLHATYDLISHQNITSHDHITFPGVVPRTCFSSGIIAGIFSLFQHLLVHGHSGASLSTLPHNFQGLDLDSLSRTEAKGRLLNAISLIIVRCIIALCTLTSLFYMLYPLRKKFFKWTVFLTMTQFHFLYYASRPLPNILAMAWVLYAQGHWIRRHFKRCFFLLGFTAVMFRGELFVLIAPMALIAVLCNWINLFSGAIVGILGMALGVALSFVVDSWFWQRILWAEGEVLFYNTFMNKSKEWGTMSWHWYFSSALPRALLVGFPLALVGLLLLVVSYWTGHRAVTTNTKPGGNDQQTERRPQNISTIPHRHIAYSKRAPVLTLGIASLIFIVLYSFLPHKELRFIFYAIPSLNILASFAMEFLWSYLRGTRAVIATRLILFGMLFASLSASIVFFYASSLNYYGADALTQLHALEANSTKPKLVHMDSYTTMNGVNRFIHQNTTLWQYSKEEVHPDFSLYSHLLTGTPQNFTSDFEVIGTQMGFDGISLRDLKIRTSPKVYIMRRRGFNTFDHDSVEQELHNFNLPTDCRQPNLKWSQKKNKITINAQIYGAHDQAYVLNALGLRFYAKDSRSKVYCISLDFFAPIDETQSQLEIMKSKIRITLTKKYTAGGKMWPRLLKDKKVPSFLKINWDEWALEENEIQIQEVFSNLHGESKKQSETVNSAPVHDSAAFTISCLKRLGVTQHAQQVYLDALNAHLNAQRVAWGSLVFALALVLGVAWL